MEQNLSLTFLRFINNEAYYNESGSNPNYKVDIVTLVAVVLLCLIGGRVYLLNDEKSDQQQTSDHADNKLDNSEDLVEDGVSIKSHTIEML